MLQNERVVAILCQVPASMSHANITQMVKSCYKIKIDYRVLVYCFCGVSLRCWPHNIQEKPLFHSNRDAVGLEKRLFSMTSVAVLECKSGSIAAQRCLFGSVIHCTRLLLAA